MDGHSQIKDVKFVTTGTLHPHQNTHNKGVSMPEDVSVQIGVDAVGLAVLVSTLGLNLITAILGVDSIKRLKNTAQKNIISKITPQDLEHDQRIQACMNRILGITDADRVAIALFTNGNDAHIFPFKYFSVLWEVCNNGIANTSYQKVPLLKIKEELQKCFKADGKFVHYRVTDNLPEPCKNYLVTNNIHTVLSRLIGSEKDGYSGIMSIHFSEDIEFPKSTMDRIDSLFMTLESMLDKKTSKRWFPFF